MRISLGELAARLERGVGEEVLRRAAERGAGVLAEGVRVRRTLPSRARPHLPRIGAGIFWMGTGKQAGTDLAGTLLSRNTLNKSEFPSDWPDEKVIDAVKDVANDPASVRTPADRGRTAVEGTRDGIGIRVIVGADGKSIITAYPTNVPRTPRR